MTSTTRSGRRRLPLGPQLGLLVALIAAVAAVLIAVYVVRRLSHHPEVAAPAPPPGTFRPTPEQWRALTFSKIAETQFPAEQQTEGQIATDDDVSVQVLPPFSGQVTQVFVRAGDHVRKTQALLAANASELVQAQSDLKTAAANVASATVQVRNAQANLVRQQALLKIEGAAVKDVQQAQNDLATAQASLRTNEAVLASVRGRMTILGIGAGEQSRLQMTGATRAATAAVVRAPLSGVVVQRQVGPGQYLNSTANGATSPLFTISDLSRVWLVGNVREEDAAKVRVGDPIAVSVLAFPGRVFRARISYVAPAIDPATRRLPIRATVMNPDEALKPAMYANFSILTGPGETAPAVPQQAVIYEGESARVWVARQGRTLALRQIRTGRSRDGLVEVLSGLAPGEEVVVSGALFIDRAANGD